MASSLHQQKLAVGDVSARGQLPYNLDLIAVGGDENTESRYYHAEETRSWTGEGDNCSLFKAAVDKHLCPAVGQHSSDIPGSDIVSIDWALTVKGKATDLEKQTRIIDSRKSRYSAHKSKHPEERDASNLPKEIDFKKVSGRYHPRLHHSRRRSSWPDGVECKKSADGKISHGDISTSRKSPLIPGVNDESMLKILHKTLPVDKHYVKKFDKIYEQPLISAGFEQSILISVQQRQELYNKYCIDKSLDSSNKTKHRKHASKGNDAHDRRTRPVNKRKMISLTETSGVKRQLGPDVDVHRGQETSTRDSRGRKESRKNSRLRQRKSDMRVLSRMSLEAKMALDETRKEMGLLPQIHPNDNSSVEPNLTQGILAFANDTLSCTDKSNEDSNNNNSVSDKTSESLIVDSKNGAQKESVCYKCNTGLNTSVSEDDVSEKSVLNRTKSLFISNSSEKFKRPVSLRSKNNYAAMSPKQTTRSRLLRGRPIPPISSIKTHECIPETAVVTITTSKETHLPFVKFENGKSTDCREPFMRREESFQITPKGYDSRFTNPIMMSGDEFSDDEYEYRREAKKRASRKCQQWLKKRDS